MTSTTCLPITAPLADEALHQLDGYFRAANFLAAGQIYLMDNALLHEPLLPEHIKPRLLGSSATGARARGSISSTPT